MRSLDFLVPAIQPLIKKICHLLTFMSFHTHLSVKYKRYFECWETKCFVSQQNVKTTKG